MDLLKYLTVRVLPFATTFFVIETSLRLSLAAKVFDSIHISSWEWLHVILLGASFDAAVLAYFLLPFTIYLLLLPQKWRGAPIDRVATMAWFFLNVYVVIYSASAEWIFWDEFGVRFNFIAVDYLVYTHEVLANIWESYPVVTLLSIELVCAATVCWVADRFFSPAPRPIRENKRAVAGSFVVVIAILVGAFFLRDIGDADINLDSDVNELSKNGIFSFFSAFRNNELPYDDFYAEGFNGIPLPQIQEVLEEEELGHVFLNPGSNDISRLVPGRGDPAKKNVMLVVLESTSARFMKRFGWSGPEITPTLDRLAHESLFFDDAYATGTRTVRGLEAISLSVPPTPGRSIVKRPGNENLASLGFIFRDRGYDTRFIYGGNGYFDNMNYFFENNGFSTIDRASFSDSETTFANAWGLCDEDIYRKAISEASKSHAAGRPFMQLMMTTSNHRPYTFPEGRPGIVATGGGRQAGVKYADYALGEFIEKAAREPWFEETVFVIIADHTANAAGKLELTPEKYHIPFLIYSPGFVAPQVFDKLTSQIDLAPILLGLLDFNYVSRFYGEDLLNDDDEQSHVYISNYQKLGYLTPEALTILRPDRTIIRYVDGLPTTPSAVDEEIVTKVIAVYRHASQWQEHLGRIPTVP
ncbi:MAG: phosphoglycerol transferase MdoB-like AlkP superfamily enzyme [Gammaproteobacteria bacterium]